MDKLTAMQTFVRVVESGGFTRAAESMNLPKARVSQRIAALEAVLGLRLLQRTTRSVRPTADGQAYYERCRLLLAEIEELEQSLRGDARAPAGLLRVEVLASFGRAVLAPALMDFQALHPGIALYLGSSDRIVHLVEEGVDCAIRGGELADSSLVARHLCDVHFGLYASPDWLARRGAPASPAELAAADCIRAAPWTLTRGPQAVVVDGASRLAFDDEDAALAACVGGAGVSAHARFAVDRQVRRGELVPVLSEWAAGVRPLQVVYPSGRHLSARLRAFVDWTVDLVARTPSLRWRPPASGAPGHPSQP